MDKLPLRENVCMLLFNKEQRLFLGERQKEKGIWQFPQGGAEPHLSLEENVLKELEEELGIGRDSLRIVKRLEATHQYDFNNPPEYAVGKWRGQNQTFWLVEFLGSDAEINLENSEPEFMAWKWCSIKEVHQLAEPKRLPGYLKPLQEFEEFLQANLAR